MRLEMGTFPVSDIVWADRTRWQDGVLEVGRAEFGTEEVFAVLENGDRQRIELGSCGAHLCAIRSGLSEGTRVRLRSQ